MGTDIHTAAEVRRNGSWQFAGAIFDSRWDFDGRPATLENLEVLSDARLVDALDFYVTDKKYGKLRDQVPASVVDACRRLDKRKKARGIVIEAAREWSRQSGWNYSRDVKPVEQVTLKALHDGVKLDPADRKALSEQQIAEQMAEEGCSREDALWAGLDLHIERYHDEPAFKTVEPFDVRNYDLFAALADVRNGAGFAGVDTGDPIVPIASPRGVPDDADPATVRELSHEHTPSWLSLAELKAYDWDRPKTSRGIVSGELYDLMQQFDTTYPWDERVQARCDELAEEGKPIENGVSGGISGQGIRVFTEAGYQAWKDAGRPNVKQPEFTSLTAFRDSDRPLESGDVATLPRTEVEVRPYVKIAWSRPLRDSISDEFFASWPALEALVPEGGTEDDVRIVFDFDS
jgi:hypothetical protein